MVFLSFKNTDDDQNITEDAQIANDVYEGLCKAGIKTFYSNITLVEKGSSLYKEAIEEALDESAVLIVIGTEIDYIKSRWVKYEWSSFHEDILADDKPNGIIVPYISESITRNEKPRPLRNLETFLIEKNTVEELVTFVINHLKENNLLYEDSSPTIYEKGIDEHSSYSVASEYERKVIERQSQLTLKTDLDAITEMLGESTEDERKYILDVGCAEGVTIRERISYIEDENLCVVGIDRDAAAVEIANANNSDKRIKFVNIALESDEFETKMEEYMKKENIPGFDLVTTTLLLRHLKDPMLALARVKKFIRKGGWVYIREQDDGNIISYGDKGLIAKMLDKHRGLSGVSDHYYGRKVHVHLLEAGYENISSSSVVRDIVNKDEYERMAVFCSQFEKRKNFIEHLASQNPSDTLLRDTLDWYEVALDRLREYFLQPDFYFSETDLTFRAQKND